MAFEHILAKASHYLTNPDFCLTEEGMVDLVCKGCDFYKEGEDEDLECGAFQILRVLLAKKVITIEELIRALKD